MDNTRRRVLKGAGAAGAVFAAFATGALKPSLHSRKRSPSAKTSCKLAKMWPNKPRFYQRVTFCGRKI